MSFTFSYFTFVIIRKMSNKLLILVSLLWTQLIGRTECMPSTVNNIAECYFMMLHIIIFIRISGSCLFVLILLRRKSERKSGGNPTWQKENERFVSNFFRNFFFTRSKNPNEKEGFLYPKCNKNTRFFCTFCRHFPLFSLDFLLVFSCFIPDLFFETLTLGKGCILVICFMLNTFKIVTMWV